MEAATPLHRPQPRVNVSADRVRIELLEIVDATLAQVVQVREQAGQPPEETVTSAAEIGARVLAREATAADVELVQREFERVSGEVERAFAERARLAAEELRKRLDQVFAGEGGELSQALGAHASGLAELIAQHFAPERRTAVQHQVEEKVRATLQESQRELIKHLSSEDGRNPLFDFKRAVTGAVQEAARRSHSEMDAVRERLEKVQIELARLREQEKARVAVEEAQERGTAKGRSFEEEVFEIVERIAAGRGDAALHVGDERGAGGGKRGDIVVEIDAAEGEAKGRFVIEAKTEQLSKNKAWDVLNESMEQRDASYGILAVASQTKMPAGREALHEYEGNKLIVPLDRGPLGTLEDSYLQCGYRLGRARCLMTREDTLRLDAAGVRAAAEEAISALREAQKIRSALTGATKNVDHARDVLDAMVERVRAQLDRVETLIEA